MNYSEMVGQLKSTEAEDFGSATTGMLLELMQVLQEIHKKNPNGALDSMAQHFQSHVVGVAQQRWSVAKYFSGKGPVANKLRDFAAINKHFAMGNFKLEDKLKLFDFKPVEDIDKAKAFRAWLEDVALNAFGARHVFAVPTPYHAGIEIGLGSGIHNQVGSYDPNVVPERRLVLSAQLPNGLVVKYVVTRGENSQLLYYHPHEEVWLADSGITHFEGVQEALAVEWEKLANQCGYTDKPIDVDASMEDILSKVDYIFDNEERVAQTTQHYVRNEDGQSSYIRFVMEEYILIFINTKGQWPSRNHVLSINGGGAFNSRIEFSQMREFARQELIKVVQAGLDAIIAGYLTEEIVVETEPLSEEKALAEAVTGDDERLVPESSTPNYNPVWRAMQAVKEKKK